MKAIFDSGPRSWTKIDSAERRSFWQCRRWSMFVRAPVFRRMISEIFPPRFRISSSIPNAPWERFLIPARKVCEISISCSRGEPTLWYCRVDGYRLLWVIIKYSVWECMNVSMHRFWLCGTLSDVTAVPTSTHKWGIALKYYWRKEKWRGSVLRALVELLVTISFSRSIREL